MPTASEILAFADAMRACYPVASGLSARLGFAQTARALAGTGCATGLGL